MLQADEEVVDARVSQGMTLGLGSGSLRNNATEDRDRPELRSFTMVHGTAYKGDSMLPCRRP